MEDINLEYLENEELLELLEIFEGMKDELSINKEGNNNGYNEEK